MIKIVRRIVRSIVKFAQVEPEVITKEVHHREFRLKVVNPFREAAFIVRGRGNTSRILDYCNMQGEVNVIVINAQETARLRREFKRLYPKHQGMLPEFISISDHERMRSNSHKPFIVDPSCLLIAGDNVDKEYLW